MNQTTLSSLTSLINSVFNLFGPVLFGIVGLILLLIVLHLTNRPKSLGSLPVTKRPLMTAAEQRVIRYIENALPNTRIHAQVSMGALMLPKKGLNKSDWFRTFNRFSSKRVDYIVEDRATGQVLLIVELDDRSHDKRKDADRDRLTRAAGYITARLPANERHTAQSVRARLHQALEPAPSTRKLSQHGSPQPRSA
ncbi:DUF2726 domain-containing protein [Croceicoccus mobilis]|uniref:DUF2726 domain-containing protein n=1 Tax=Croceicoccus mobilis TaxID=1703339 RepID=A0A916ZA25_9SPHN|nr:DUF2726 domain-containing protein [Croceicoccus mobilis]GGD81927.1 hypothetical protein GCM10010990_34870 [Croceicoccus mobilis]